MNIVITSEQRVGSRWMHYLLAELYNKRASPEIDRNRVIERADEARKYLRNNRIVKYHGPLPDEIVDGLRPIDYKILGVVRNPMDRAVSVAFHNRYHNKHPFIQKKASSDEDAVRMTVYEDKGFLSSNYRQFDLMLPAYSTRNYLGGDLPYIWTAYEWLVEDTLHEVTKIAQFFGDVPNGIGTVVNNHSFRNKAGRKRGVEQRRNLWRRKGVNNDYLNWFDDDMIKHMTSLQDNYFYFIDKEIGT